MDFEKSYTTSMANINSVTNDTVSNLKKQLDTLRSTISQIDALMQSKANVTGGETLTQKVADRAANRLTSVPQFGDGGYVDRPTLAVVGEKEPEYIIPKSKVPAMGSSVTVHMGTVYISKEADATR